MRSIWFAVVLACSKPADPRPVVDPPPASKPEDRHDPAATRPLALTITIGGASSTWTDTILSATPKLTGTASDGEARDTWSLRELVHRNVSPTARVTAVLNAGGKQTIDDSAWNDATHIPILHTTKRGTLKFRWADPSGAWGETVLKDVTALEVVR